MVCKLCEGFRSRPISSECFGDLLTLLKAHYEVKNQQCQRNDDEVRFLKQLTTNQELHSTNSGNTDLTMDSPPLFSQNSTFNDDVSENSPQMKPNIEVVIKEEKTPLKLEARRELASGWRTKPSSMSFRRLDAIETQGRSEKSNKASKNTGTIDTFFNKRPEPAPALSVPKSLPQPIIIDDDDDLIADAKHNNTTFCAELEMDLSKDNSGLTNPLNRNAPKRSPRPGSSNRIDQLCDVCNNYFDYVKSKWTKTEWEHRIRECEKQHRQQKIAGHETPDGFWQVKFDSTPDNMKTQGFFKGKIKTEK